MADLIRKDLEMTPRPPYRRREKRSRQAAWWKALARKSSRGSLPAHSNTRLERRGSSANRTPRAFMQPSVVKRAKRERMPCVVHAHELEPMLHGLNEDNLQSLIENPGLIIAGSGGLLTNLSSLDGACCWRIWSKRLPL